MGHYSADHSFIRPCSFYVHQLMRMEGLGLHHLRTKIDSQTLLFISPKKKNYYYYYNSCPCHYFDLTPIYVHDLFTILMHVTSK